MPLVQFSVRLLDLDCDIKYPEGRQNRVAFPMAHTMDHPGNYNYYGFWSGAWLHGLLVVSLKRHVGCHFVWYMWVFWENQLCSNWVMWRIEFVSIVIWSLRISQCLMGRMTRAEVLTLAHDYTLWTVSADAVLNICCCSGSFVGVCVRDIVN